MELSDRVVVMNRGKIEQVGSPDDIYDQPATPFVAEFIGSTNRLEVKLDGDRASVEGHRVDLPPGVLQRDGSGESVAWYVRPHEVELRLVSGRGAIPSDVVRIMRLGWVVKLELRLPSGRVVLVQQTREQVDELGLAPGDLVYLALRGAKAFPAAYSI